MTAGNVPRTASSRTKKLLAISAALIASVTVASPAFTLPTGTGVEVGRNISVFHNLDFVASFGQGVGDPLTVDVYRNGVRIGQAFGPAVLTPEGGGIEVNHGPAGTAAQGDCWEGYTPDILPGDRIVVTNNADPAVPVVDEVLVDDINIDEGPREDVTTPDDSDIVVKGHARYANGTPIEIIDLNSGELRLGSTFRANPNTVERTPGTTDGWTATYKAPYNAFRNRGLTLAQQKQAILDGDHAMGYGHVVPLPSETQLVEGIGGGGPALGCEVSPSAPNAVAAFDDRFVNSGSGDLEVTGVAVAATESISISIDDEDPATPAVTADVAPENLSPVGPGGKTWTVNVPRNLQSSTNDLDSLADGRLTVSGTYVGGGTGRSRTIVKDTVAPSIQADPASGTTHTGSVGVALSLVSGENLKIRYATDGSDPKLGRTYSGQRIELGVGTNQTIKASATDAAGNVTEEAFTYTVNAPEPPPPVIQPPPPPSGRPIVGTAGNDVLRGTPGNDAISGGGGNDTIIGGGGRDTINGGPGNDTIRGGPGNDTLVGGSGVDRLFGESGNDRLNGRDGRPRDLLNGGSGRDTASKDRGDIVRSIP